MVPGWQHMASKSSGDCCRWSHKQSHTNHYWSNPWGEKQIKMYGKNVFIVTYVKLFASWVWMLLESCNDWGILTTFVNCQKADYYLIVFIKVQLAVDLSSHEDITAKLAAKLVRLLPVEQRLQHHPNQNMPCSCRTMPSTLLQTRNIFIAHTCWAQEWEGAHWQGPCTWCTQSHQLAPGKVQFYNLAWEQVLTSIEETREAVSVHEVSAADESELNIDKFAVKHSHVLEYSRSNSPDMRLPWSKIGWEHPVLVFISSSLRTESQAEMPASFPTRGLLSK